MLKYGKWIDYQVSHIFASYFHWLGHKHTRLNTYYIHYMLVMFYSAVSSGACIIKPFIVIAALS